MLIDHQNDVVCTERAASRFIGEFPHGLMLLKPNQTIAATNRVFLDIFDSPPVSDERFRDHTFSDFWDEAVIEPSACEFLRTLVLPPTLYNNPVKQTITLKSGHRRYVCVSTKWLYCSVHNCELQLLSIQDRTLETIDHLPFTLKTALVLSPEQITVLDADGTIVFANWLPASYVGRRFTNTFLDLSPRPNSHDPMEDENRYAHTLLQVLHTKEPIVDEVVYQPWLGCSMRTTVQPIHDHTHVFRGIVAYSSDITHFHHQVHQVQRQEQLESVQKLLRQTAHEVKNPLSAISALAQLGVLHEAIGAKDRAFARIVKEIEHLHDLLGHLTELAPVGQTRLVPEDPNPVIREVSELIVGELCLKSASVRIELTEDIGIVKIDRRLFRQAILNLTQNAIHALDTGGEICIITRCDSTSFHVVIEDNGCGMSPDVLLRLGSPFFTTREEGTGLGVSIATQIIEQVHHGSIHFASAVGEGTRVRISIPCSH